MKPITDIVAFDWTGLDWTVLGFGTLALVGDLGTVDIALAARVAHHRDRGRMQRARRESRVAALALSSGLPVSAVTGIRFDLESDS